MASRDEWAFRELYRRYTPALYLFAIRMLGGIEQDAEDAVQETWIRAAASLERFAWKSSLRTWLFGIAVNCCREILRARVATAEAPVEESAAPPSLELEQLIRRLPDGCREVFLLFYVEGYRHDDIAALLGIAVGTSKHQLFVARRKLRDWLDM